jgi:TonB family protein
MPNVSTRFLTTHRARWTASLVVSLSLHVSAALAATLTVGSLLSHPTLEQRAGRAGQVELQASLADWSQPLPMPEVTMPPPEIRVTPDHAVMADRTYQQTSTTLARPTPTEAAWVDQQLHRPPAPDVPRVELEQTAAKLEKITPAAAERLPRRERPPQIETVVVSAPSLPSTKALGTSDMQTPQPRFDNRPPQYPPEAIALGWEGAVDLRLHLSAAGDVVRVDIVATSGRGVLDAAAIRAARTWRFEPAYQGGRSVAATVRQSVRFRLQ